MPVYNGEKYLRQAIESCLNQTYTNIELIIINDASTDGSLAIINDFADTDDRIKIVTNSINKRLPTSLNIGHKLAKGDFMTWTSDDNLYQKDAIKTMYNSILESKSDIVYCDYLIMDDDGVIVDQAHLKPIEYLLFYGVIGACFLYKKEVYVNNNGYNENLFLVEDYDFWLRALKHSSFTKINNPGYYLYRYHKNSLTVQMNNDQELRNIFLKNLSSLYESFFDNENLKRKDILIDFLIDRFLNGTSESINFIKTNYFFEDFKEMSSTFINFSFDKLKRTILNNCIEEILKNKKYQTLANFIFLHKISMDTLLRLSIKRYLVLTKKCLF